MAISTSCTTSLGLVLFGSISFDTPKQQKKGHERSCGAALQAAAHQHSIILPLLSSRHLPPINCSTLTHISIDMV